MLSVTHGADYFLKLYELPSITDLICSCFENVKNILTVDSGDVLSEISHSIEEIGYTLKHYVLNSSHFGVPQRRERVYFVALRNDSQLKHSNPQPTYKRQYLRDILMDNDLCEPLIIKRNDIFIKDEPNNLALAPIQIGYVNKGGQGERIYSVKGHAVTQSASSGGVGKRCGLYKVNGEIRRLHIKEAKRVMGFKHRTPCKWWLAWLFSIRQFSYPIHDKYNLSVSEGAMMIADRNNFEKGNKIETLLTKILEQEPSCIDALKLGSWNGR